jgi:hypothetical protein
MWCAFMVDGVSDGSHLASGLGVFDDGGLIHPLRGPALEQFGHMGVEGCLLVG